MIRNSKVRVQVEVGCLSSSTVILASINRYDTINCPIKVQGAKYLNEYIKLKLDCTFQLSFSLKQIH